VRLGEIFNRYLCEFKSLQDNNTIPLIFIEKGFSPITSSLLSNNIIVCVLCERRLSANLEIFLECTINEETVRVLGKTLPGFSYEDL